MAVRRRREARRPVTTARPPPSRGRLGEFAANPSPTTGTAQEVRRELGALAQELPLTGLMLWALVLSGLLILTGAGTARRWSIAR